MRMTESPRTNNISIVLFVVFGISSYVSWSTSVVVKVSSTSPRTIFRCWSNACKKEGERNNNNEPNKSAKVCS